jgi:hypothetical protein
LVLLFPTANRPFNVIPVFPEIFIVQVTVFKTLAAVTARPLSVSSPAQNLEPSCPIYAPVVFETPALSSLSKCLLLGAVLLNAVGALRLPEDGAPVSSKVSLQN